MDALLAYCFLTPGFKNIYCKGSKHLQNFPYQVKFAYCEPRNIRFLENFVHVLNGWSQTSFTLTVIFLWYEKAHINSDTQNDLVLSIPHHEPDDSVSG